MAKKQKKNLQSLITKKQQLQQLSQGAVISFADQKAFVQAPKVVAETRPETKTGSQAQNHFQTIGTGRELRKTAISILLIALLLAGAVIFDHKTPYFSHFGDWLYKALRLQS